MGQRSWKRKSRADAARGTKLCEPHAEGVGLERISSLLRLPVSIASTAAARVEARWPALEVERAAANASVRLMPRRSSPAKDVIPVAATIDAGIRDGRITIGVKDLQSLAATASGEVQVGGRRALSGQLVVEAALVVLHRGRRRSIPGSRAGSLIGMPVEGALASTVNLMGTLSSPVVSVTASVPGLSAGDLKDISVNAAATYTQARLTIDDATVRWQDQILRAAGEIGFAGPRSPSGSQHGRKTSHWMPPWRASGRHDLPVAGISRRNSRPAERSRIHKQR